MRLLYSIIAGICISLASYANNAVYLHKTGCDANVFCTFESLYTDRLVIRHFTIEDEAALHAMMTDKQVVNQTIALQLHDNQEQTHYLLQSIMRMYEPHFTDTIILAIADKETNQVMGYCGFYAYAPLFNRAEIGYALRSEYGGKGIVPEACKVLVAYGFERCNFNRIEATVYPENIGSIRICEKLGMKQEAVMRQHVMREDVYRDRLLFSFY